MGSWEAGALQRKAESKLMEFVTPNFDFGLSLSGETAEFPLQ